jgi:hypothetical protein
MKKDLTQESFIKINTKWLKWALILLLGIVIVGLASFGVVKANDYYQVNKLVKASDELVKQAKYQDAYNDLTLTQTRWTTDKVRKEIATKMSSDKQLIADQNNYTNGNNSFKQSKWQDAKNSYTKVSAQFPSYKDAQAKAKECQTKIDAADALAKQQTDQATANLAQQQTNVSSPQPTDTPEPSPEPIKTCNDAQKQYALQHQNNLYAELQNNLKASNTANLAQISAYYNSISPDAQQSKEQVDIDNENASYQHALVYAQQVHQDKINQINSTCY